MQFFPDFHSVLCESRRDLCDHVFINNFTLTIKMTLDHAAIWTDNLELLKEFYVKYFDGQAGDRYTNEANRFHSYFISFQSGARLEIMSRPGVPDNLNDTVDAQHKGLIHMAFGVDTMREVD